MENFTPYSALAGGVLIGVAATFLLALSGRVAGVSGILFGLIQPARGEVLWRLLFLIGLVGGAVAYRTMAAPGETIAIEASLPLLILGGLLTGFGTRLGDGCTSGHGVCGIGALSLRSLAATVTFMVTGMITVFIIRHVAGG